MLWLFAIVAGLVFRLVTGGKITNLARLRFRWPWVILVAIAARAAVVLTPLSRVEGAQYVFVIAIAAIVAWTIAHFNRLPGVWLVTAGTLLNLLVIVANGARMPVAPELAVSLARHGTIGPYTVMGPDTNLNLLGDWIALYPVPEVYSIGDVVIAIGLAVVVFLAVRNLNPYSDLTPP